MIAFFTILAALLAINALLLIFSANGAKQRFKRPIQRIPENSITKLVPKESSETKYKKAV